MCELWYDYAKPKYGEIVYIKMDDILQRYYRKC